MSFENTKCGGLDATLGLVGGPGTSAIHLAAHTSDGGNKYDPNDEFSPFIGSVSTDNGFDCAGPKGTVHCLGGFGADLMYEWDTPPFYATTDGSVHLSDLVASGEADFYANVTCEATLSGLTAKAFGCDPGGPGLFDPGPSCVLDVIPEIGLDVDEIHIRLDASSDGFSPAPPYNVVHLSATQVVLQRTDPPASWPYQNSLAGLGSPYAEQGSWIYTPGEIAHLLLTIQNTTKIAAINWSAVMRVTPMKWAYGYGPPKTKLMCLV